MIEYPIFLLFILICNIVTAVLTVEEIMDHRPNWLPDPPPDVLHEGPRGSSLGVTFGTFSKGAAFEPFLRKYTLDKLSRAGFTRVVAWKEDDLLKFVEQQESIHPHFGKILSMKNVTGTAPYCWSFKAIVLWYSLLTSKEGDYVMWGDASRHHNGFIGDQGENIIDAIKMLNGSVDNSSIELHSHQSIWDHFAKSTGNQSSKLVDTVPGLMHCHVSCASQLYFPIEAVNGTSDRVSTIQILKMYSEFLPEIRTDEAFCNLINAPIRLGTNMLFKNTPFNRLFIWDWISMMTFHAEKFCGNINSEQTTLSILAINRSVPYVNTCKFIVDGNYHGFLNSDPKRHGRIRACANMEKNISHVIVALAKGAYELVDYSLPNWINRVRPKKTSKSGYGLQLEMCHKFAAEWNTV